MASADWSTSATMSWLSLKSRPTSSMPFMRGPLMISSAPAAAPVDQVLGQPPLLLGDGRVSLEPLRVDDGVVEPGLGAVIEEDGVQHLAAGRRQAEGDIGDPEDGLALGEAGLDGPDALDGLDGGADVVDVARAHGKDEGVEDQIAGGHAVLLREEGMGALGDGELARPRHRHPLLLVLVDAADDHGAAIGAQERDDLLEALFPVLQVDRVDDGLALAGPQGPLDHHGIRGVDHERDLDLARDLLHEAVHVRRLVTVRIGEADVQHLRPALDLRAPNLRAFLELVLDDEVLELARADDVGPLADEHGPVVVGGIERLDAADGGGP